MRKIGATGHSFGCMARRQRVTPASSSWLSTNEAARLSGYSVYTLRDWAKQGLVPAQYLIVTPGGYLWHREFAARPQPLRIAPVEAAQCDLPTRPRAPLRGAERHAN